MKAVPPCVPKSTCPNPGADLVWEWADKARGIDRSRARSGRLAGLASASLRRCSGRVLEILCPIQEGHSDQDIGELLFLSPSTDKWRNQSIFSRLDIQRRTEAVPRAVQLKLLQVHVALRLAQQTILCKGYQKRCIVQMQCLTTPPRYGPSHDLLSSAHPGLAGDPSHCRTGPSIRGWLDADSDRWYITGWSHDDGCPVLPDDGRAASNRHGTVELNRCAMVGSHSATTAFFEAWLAFERDEVKP